MSTSKPAPKGGAAVQSDDSFDAGLSVVDPALGSGDAPEPDSDAAAAALRMDMLGASGDDGPLEPPKRSFVGSQNALLALVILAAGGALFAMRYLGMGPRSSIAEQARLPFEVDRPRDVSFTQHKQAIAELSASRIVSQVPGDQVQRNPFALEGIIQVSQRAPAPAAGESAEARAARLAAEKQARDAASHAQQIQTTVAGLTVNSVIVGGPVPVARINGDLYRIGDVIDELLTIKDIHGRGVVLEADGKTYAIDVAEGKSAAPSTHRPATPPPRR